MIRVSTIWFIRICSLTSRSIFEQLLSGYRFEVRKIEAQALRLHQGTLLTDVITEDRPQGRMQQVSRRMIERRVATPLVVDLCHHAVANAQCAGFQLTNVRKHCACLLACIANDKLNLFANG